MCHVGQREEDIYVQQIGHRELDRACLIEEMETGLPPGLSGVIRSPVMGSRTKPGKVVAAKARRGAFFFALVLVVSVGIGLNVTAAEGLTSPRMVARG